MKRISTEELHSVRNKNGLVIQGCGGDPGAWIDAINATLTEQRILQNKTVFQKVSVFEHDGHTNLLFHMDGVDLDPARLALWRIFTYARYQCTPLNIFLLNQADMNINEKKLQHEKPDCPDENSFNMKME